MAQGRDHFGDIVSAVYSVSLFTDWQKGRVNEVWVKRRVEKGETLMASQEFYGARAATTKVHQRSACATVAACHLRFRGADRRLSCQELLGNFRHRPEKFLRSLCPAPATR